MTTKEGKGHFNLLPAEGLSADLLLPTGLPAELGMYQRLPELDLLVGADRKITLEAVKNIFALETAGSAMNRIESTRSTTQVQTVEDPEGIYFIRRDLKIGRFRKPEFGNFGRILSVPSLVSATSYVAFNARKPIEDIDWDSADLTVKATWEKPITMGLHVVYSSADVEVTERQPHFSRTKEWNCRIRRDLGKKIVLSLPGQASHSGQVYEFDYKGRKLAEPTERGPLKLP